jgi:hypothetical protein
MKKVFMAVITSMSMLANVFAGDAKPLESKNEFCIVIDKAILRDVWVQNKRGKRARESGEWVTDFKIVADYYRYIAKNNRLGLGLGVNITPELEFYDIYGTAKIKVPLTNRWFLGVGAGLGNRNTKSIAKTNHHEYFKLFTCFNFKNISIYLSYTQDILYGEQFNRRGRKLGDFTGTFEAYNLGIGMRFTI